MELTWLYTDLGTLSVSWVGGWQGAGCWVALAGVPGWSAGCYCYTAQNCRTAAGWETWRWWWWWGWGLCCGPPCTKRLYKNVFFYSLYNFHFFGDVVPQGREGNLSRRQTKTKKLFFQCKLFQKTKIVKGYFYSKLLISKNHININFINFGKFWLPWD